MGAEFEQRMSVWLLADGGSIFVQKYTGTTEAGSATLETKTKRQFDDDLDRARAARTKKDI